MVFLPFFRLHVGILQRVLSMPLRPLPDMVRFAVRCLPSGEYCVVIPLFVVATTP